MQVCGEVIMVGEGSLLVAVVTGKTGFPSVGLAIDGMGRVRVGWNWLELGGTRALDQVVYGTL